jgi:hypothetical protein
MREYRKDATGNRTLRTTSLIALAFAGLGLLAALFSVYVMATRPWGCSYSGSSTVASCDWVTSRWVAAVWLAFALGIGLISWKRWTVALAIVSMVLIGFSLISFAGVFTLAPSVFWFGCALWTWSRDRRLWIALTALATVGLVSLGVIGVLSLVYLVQAPIV